MKNFLQVVFCLLAITSGFSQNYKFGKVSEEDFKKYGTPSSSHNAVVLYKSQTIDFTYVEGEGFQQENEIHERIVIYNKEGFDWATKKVKLYDYSASKEENLIGLKGYTYNLVDGKVEKEKLRNEGVFEEKQNKYWKKTSFTMPNIKEGCIIEFTYKIVSPYLSIDDIDLQYTIPIKTFDLSVNTPEFYVYREHLNPRAFYLPELQKTQITRTLSKTERSMYGHASQFTQSKTDYNVNVIKSQASDVPALKQEPMVGNIDNYRSKLILELVAKRFPNQPTESFSTSWGKVAETIYEDDDFGKQLDRNNFFKKDLQSLTVAENKMQTAANIYSFVKNKVKWNSFVGYGSQNGIKKAYVEGSGNVADINLLLVAMLREAGINANPVLLSTISNGIPLVPTVSGFNYVICLVEEENFRTLLDASDPYGSPNVLPQHALNWQGRVIRKDESSDWVSLSELPLSSETSLLNVNINSDLAISGKARSNYTNYLAHEYLKNFLNVNKDDHIKQLEKEKGDVVISELAFKHSKTSAKPVTVSYDYKLENAIEEIGGKLYFSPLFFLGQINNPYKDSERLYPIQFNYPKVIKSMVNIKLPEGYHIESLPQNEKIVFNGDSGMFSYLLKNNGETLQLLINFDFKDALVLPSHYEHFKTFYTKVIEKMNEQVVLKKV
ncbi:hypothetical protein IA57_02515 [Mangrovimonas yunxiaonensis]|uniref:Transglutaminase-like domain-containing protein n=1 Tax=Mangrovimonas yunxiaonensis TaxID=1197477 RepID=A0A084TM31_9FLAO|nr:transglutaminase domain-containing protein [Mangrovimonas yunxiaonensis]KFB01767.1 hypothetical protein IA57_02515 [Mangrovimonas yunxiaonensis]GGH40864.1 hypothetical protein GCM10011364_11290 [Mangrovimonas yunxiaonensis]